MANRRETLLGAAAALLAAPGFALAQPARSISDVRVDLSALRAGGWNGTALSVVNQSLTGALRAAFADRMGGGPLLVVRITAIHLTGAGGSVDAGIGAPRGGGNNSGVSDSMEGELILVGRGNTIIERRPLLNALPPEGSAAWWREDNELRRLSALSENYAQWARRQLG